MAKSKIEIKKGKAEMATTTVPDRKKALDAALVQIDRSFG